MSNIFSAEYIFKTNVAKVYEGKQLQKKPMVGVLQKRCS